MKTVTGLFDNYNDASAAVSALEARGVPSDDISIVSNNADNSHRHEDNDNGAAEGAGTGAGIGAVVGGAGGLLTGLGLMAIPGVGPVVAAGWLAATAAGALAGAGPVGRPGCPHRARAVDDHQRVQRTVDAGDALEVRLGRFDRAQPAVSYGACKPRRRFKARIHACLP